MKLGRIVLAWIVRNAFALALIILLLLVARHIAPPATEWLGAQSAALRTVPAQQASYLEASRAFDAYAVRRAEQARDLSSRLAAATEDRLRSRRRAIAREIAREEGARLSPARLALAAARRDGEAVFRHHRAGAEIALLQGERAQIDAVLNARVARREDFRLEAQRDLAVQQLRTSYREWKAARRRIDQLQNRFLAEPRNAVCRLNPLDVGCPNYRSLRAARAAAEAALARNQEARGRIAAMDQARRRLSSAGAVVESAQTVLDRQQAALSAEVGRLNQEAQDSLLLRIWSAAADVLPAALLILGVALAGPVLVKAVLFFGVAPLAERRPPIRLLPDDEGRGVVADRSAVSQKVTLSPGEELLVVPQALKSTPHHGAKRTRWLLRATMPLSSLASGLFALTQIRLERPDSVLVSATGGPLAEVALVRLERGSALVLKPRALRGLVQPTEEPVRITRRWRLGLSAWLTLQFRYLIFHGPCTLIVEGTRGVRVEHAGLGRGINQAATLGFSAGLAYGVSRTETFGAYLLGRQALFNDSFQSANGHHLHEEAPASAGKGGLWTGGLRGLGDAALKLVGL